MYRYDRFCQSLSLCTVLVSMHARVWCVSGCARARLVRCVRAVFLRCSLCVCYIYISIIIYRGGVFDARAGVTDPEPMRHLETHISHTRICTLPRLSESAGGRLCYLQGSVRSCYLRALSTRVSPKPRYLPGAVRSRVIYPVGLSEAALSTVTVCDLGLIWGHQHRRDPHGGQ